MKKQPTATVTFLITKRQCMFGVTSGEHGCRGYDWHPPDSDETQKSLHGVPLDCLLNEELGDGTTLEVTVKVLKRGKLKTNPWLKRRG